MNKTKIEWCTRTWNPVTGCRHGCEYCYAARIANRFGGHFEESQKLHELYAPMVYGEQKPRKDAFPFGFEPTLHRYRLDEPAMELDPQTIFVVSMGDLFGDWVPTCWIMEVFEFCLAAPWHTYMFLTKNPHRYTLLDEMALLPHGDNFWYGTTVTGDGDIERAYELPHDVHTFWSVEPMMGAIPYEAIRVQEPDLVIVGAETGTRKNKVVPEREWIDDLLDSCVRVRLPVFMKDNIRKLFPDLPASAPMPGRGKK